MKRLLLITLISIILAVMGLPSKAQSNKSLVYIDPAGRMRWQKDKSEVYLFGVNYTVPFAYGYRSIKALNRDLEKEIDQDVYHLARMGVDAFRVHIWDTEISDTSGNLLANEHLKLFDYLVWKLKQRGIKIIITPIAFWGNGYPQRDEKTAGFSSKYNKNQATVNEHAIRAQENYLKQLLIHENPYTKLNYRDEPDIIAAELNNEPSHSGSKANVTAYINRLTLAARSTGWSKPLFYNIAQSPFYADAVAKSAVNGFSFQWYPTGLVANHEQKGNMIPNVDSYTIPFDTIPEFRNKPKMVYEFDAADVLQSCMYPMVAKSFKMAGFQWVTQFAYDPIGTAYGNTEYQTHFLNLAYTPAKAISFLIANRAFTLLPRKDYGSYPADSIFDAFYVSYNQGMSAMNTAKEFYYSGTTTLSPIDVSKLEHIAGVGSSAIINYPGYGAYFMDKLENGVWRLEVMPDAITIRDPFEKASPSKEVVHIQWADQPLAINLADLGSDFSIKGISENNTYQTAASNGCFVIKPGTYLLVKKGKSAAKWTNDKRTGTLTLNEFAAPQPFNNVPFIVHTPAFELSAGKPALVKVKIINISADANVTLVTNRGFGPAANIKMIRSTPYDYSATIPASQVSPGLLSYRIVIQNGLDYVSFPGAHQGDPFSWDNVNNDSWQTFVAAPNGKLTLFEAKSDYGRANTYSAARGRSAAPQFTAGEQTGALAFHVIAPAFKQGEVMGLQLYVADKINNRLPEVASYTKIVVRARLQGAPYGKLRLALIDNGGSAYAASVDLTTEFKDMEIPLSAFAPDSCLLLPRPYPSFLPLWFKSSSAAGLNLAKLDKLEVTAGAGLTAEQLNKPFGFELESVWLKP